MAQDYTLQSRFIKLLAETPGGLFIRYFAEKEGVNYYRVYRLAKRLDSQGYIILEKVDGLLLAKMTEKTLELLKPRPKPEPKPEDKGPRRNYHWTKWRARGLLKQVKLLETPEQWAQLRALFTLYLEDTEKKALVFMNEEGETLIGPYDHRFTPKRLNRALRNFERAWAILSQGAREAVFLTLTVDPKRYPNLFVSNKQGRKNWDNFRRWLAKRLKKQGKRLRYIAIPEFTDKGLIHLHVVIFGVKRIADKKTEITPEAISTGFGPVNWVAPLKLTHDSVFTWEDGAKPPNAREEKVKDYLKKYLRKSLKSPVTEGAPDLAQRPEDLKVALYWALDIRFFTHSRIPDPLPRAKHSGPSPWRFIGAYYVWSEIIWVYRDRAVYVSPSLGPPLA